MLCVLNRLSSRLQRWLCAWPQGRAGRSEPSDASACSRMHWRRCSLSVEWVFIFIL